MENEDAVNKRIGKNIAAFRKGANLTQAELAQKINYSDKSVSKWESGNGAPDVYVLMSLAELFGVTVNDLVGESAVAHKYLHQARKAPLFARAAMPHIGAKAPDRNRFLEIDFRQDLQDAAEADTTNHMARQFLEAYDIIWNKYRNGRR